MVVVYLSIKDNLRDIDKCKIRFIRYIKIILKLIWKIRFYLKINLSV